MKFKVTYRKIVTHVRTEGEWEVEVEAASEVQAQQIVRSVVDSGVVAGFAHGTKLGVPRKVCETLGADTSETKHEIRKIRSEGPEPRVEPRAEPKFTEEEIATGLRLFRLQPDSPWTAFCELRHPFVGMPLERKQRLYDHITALLESGHHED